LWKIWFISATCVCASNGGQRVDVGAAVERVALDLLGRHVGERAHAVDLRRLGIGVEHAAEVAQLDVDDLAFLHHGEDVGGLDVAVDQALAEHVAERHRALEADLDDLLQRQQAIGPAEVAQRHAGHVLHHQVGHLGVAERLVQLHDVGVVQPPHQRGLGGEEARPEVRVDGRRLGRQPQALDRDLAVARLVARPEHLAGGAVAQAPEHHVLADRLWQLAVRQVALGLLGVEDGVAHQDGFVVGDAGVWPSDAMCQVRYCASEAGSDPARSGRFPGCSL
jgi:hypothetical protein